MAESLKVVSEFVCKSDNQLVSELVNMSVSLEANRPLS